MKLPAASPLLLYLALLLEQRAGVAAVRFSAKARSARPAAAPGLSGRASIYSPPDIENQGDIQYRTNVSLNGKAFEVLLDTGSSDLYVVGSVPGAKDTGKIGSVTYAIGATKGPIKLATLEFEGHRVNEQAFIEQPVDDAHPEGDGIIGFGPSSVSEIRHELNGPAGDPVLDRIFRQDMSTPNFFTVLLGRKKDPTDSFVGDFTVGELVEPFGNITTQPKLEVSELHNGQSSHWIVHLDKDGLIGPDGLPIPMQSKTTPKDRLNCMMDTGFSFSQVPQAVAKAIYGRVPGAILVNVPAAHAPLWVLPCQTELNLIFKFGGVEIPVHPLDTVTDSLQGPPDDQGNPTCVGSFQPITTAVDDEFDLILGMNFLKNAYMLVNMGDYVSGTKVRDTPYMQLLAITEMVEARSDFAIMRTNGKDISGELQLLPALPANEFVAKDGDKDKDEDKIQKFLPYIIVGSVVVGLGIIALLLYLIFGRSGKKYRRLNEPAPGGLPTANQPFTQYQPTRRY